MNLIGQLRLYSAVDLALLLLAAKANPVQVFGSFCLWFGFLLYLESCHRHVYRRDFPKILWPTLITLAVVAFHRPESLGFIAYFILCSWLYAKKNEPQFGLGAPLFRGLQSLALVGGIQGYTGAFAWLALTLTVIRNTLGDVRDTDKDREQGMLTIPIILGWRSISYIHMIGVFATSVVWLSFTRLSWAWLPVVWLVEIVTYNWTPRNVHYQ